MVIMVCAVCPWQHRPCPSCSLRPGEMLRCGADAVNVLSCVWTGVSISQYGHSMTLGREDKLRRKTDTDSGIHSFGSAGSLRGLDLKVSDERRDWCWRDHLLGQAGSVRLGKISRSETGRTRSQSYHPPLPPPPSTRRARSYSRVSGHRLSLISSHHHIPRVALTSLKRRDSLQSSPVSPTSSLEEEALSLSFIKSNAIIHQYVASRGQREKEIEIYEVLPTTIIKTKQRHPPPSSSSSSSSRPPTVVLSYKN